MKRMNIMKFLRVGGVALATGYFSMFSGISQAGDIAGSVHDFSDGFWADGSAYTNVWNPNNELCTVCHTPHAADTTNTLAPLWGRGALTATVFALYNTSSTFDGVATIGQPGGISQLCLSCHDGSIALDSFAGGGGTGTLITDAGASRNIGGNTDTAGTANSLRDDHPISFEYSDALDPGIFPDATAGIVIGDLGDRNKSGTLAEMMLTDDGAGTLTVECTSCHDVHNNYVGSDNYRLLKVNLTASALCLTCHDK